MSVGDRSENATSDALLVVAGERSGSASRKGSSVLEGSGKRRGGGNADNSDPGENNERDRRRSRKFLNQWKHATAMSKLGNRTRHLLGKFRSIDGSSMSVENSSTVQSQSDSVMESNNTKSGEVEGNNGNESNESNSGVKQAKKGWSEHVWTAWVHRGYSDEVTDVRQLQPGADLLSTFQKEKFTYFFHHVLDLNSDNVISSEDFEKLNERIRHYMDLSPHSIQFLAIKEVHLTFLDCFLTTAADMPSNKEDHFDFWDPFKKLDTLHERLEHVTLADVLREESERPVKLCVTLAEWLDVWGHLVGRAKKMGDLPMWLQFYPKVLFDIINRSGKGIITRKELKCFYTAFMDVGKLGEAKLEEVTDNAFAALTSTGDIELTFHVFKLSFLNFLLGRQPNGPGQFLFGTVKASQQSCMFPIDYSAMNAADEDLEPFREQLEEKGSRRSVLV